MNGQAESRRAAWPAVNPADANAAGRAGLAALESGNEVAALPLLDAARAFHPRDSRLWHVTALLHRSLDDLAPALGAFEKAAAPLRPAIRSSPSIMPGPPSTRAFPRSISTSRL